MTKFVLVVGTLMLSLVLPPRAQVLSATADSFSPAPAKVKRHRAPGRRRTPAVAPAAGEATPAAESSDEEAPAARATPRGRPSPAEADTPEESSDEDEEDDEKPKAVTRRKEARRHAAKDEEGEGEDEEEEDDEQDAPFTSMPVVLPRLITFGVGGSLLGRSFAFNGPLQKENAFPRAGVVASLEAYPLIRMGRGWFRTLGFAANLGIEFGSAALLDPGTGLTASYPVSQRRYSFDVRYAIPAGDRLVIVPAVGLGNSTFDLKNRMPVAPSECNGMPPMVGGITPPCLADVQATYFLADLHLRLAATDRFALSLSGGYFLGLAVGRGQGQLGQERTPKMSGFHGALGAMLMLSDWLALRAELPVIRYSTTFSGGTVTTYSAATETYYGATVSAVIFTQ